MNDLRHAACVILALAGLLAPVQAPAASKGAKAGEPVFADFVVPPPAAPATNATAAGEQKAEVGGQRTEAMAGTNATAAAPASLSGYVPDDKYKLRVGDKISLQILEDRDAPKSLVVADSGELDAPYAGRVPAADKTCKQLAEELKARLEREYYHRATVVIALDLANKLLGRVYVWGQVRQQGGIDLTVNESLTAGKAILRAGGFADFANKKKVKVIRSGTAGGAAKETFELNMVDILERGKPEKDVVLQPEDFVIVPSRLINF